MDDCVAGVEGIPYCACKQAGVTCVSQDAGTSSALALTDAVRLVLRATFVTGGIVLFTGNLQRCHSVPELYKKKQIGRNYAMVGWMKLMWSFNEAGMEYDRVRTAFVPESSCVNVEKSAPRSSLAFPTVVLTAIQSPEGDTLEDVRPFDESHSLIAETVSDEGATSSST